MRSLQYFECEEGHGLFVLESAVTPTKAEDEGEEDVDPEEAAKEPETEVAWVVTGGDKGALV